MIPNMVRARGQNPSCVVFLSFQCCFFFSCASQHFLKISRENPDLQVEDDLCWFPFFRLESTTSGPSMHPQPLTAVQVEGKSFSQWDKALVVPNDLVSWWQHLCSFNCPGFTPRLMSQWMGKWSISRGLSYQKYGTILYLLNKGWLMFFPGLCCPLYYIYNIIYCGLRIIHQLGINNLSS